jgi:hypothetical protein
VLIEGATEEREKQLEASSLPVLFSSELCHLQQESWGFWIWGGGAAYICHSHPQAPWILSFRDTARAPPPLLIFTPAGCCSQSFGELAPLLSAAHRTLWWVCIGHLPPCVLSPQASCLLQVLVPRPSRSISLSGT